MQKERPHYLTFNARPQVQNETAGCRTIDFVLRELLRVRDRGAAVLLLSADLDEVWHVADRVMVMSQGRVRGPVSLGATTRQEVGHWMMGTA